MFYEEVCDWLRCSQQSIDRIRVAKRNKGKINVYPRRVRAADGREVKRPMLSRNELSRLFKPQPSAGEPIIVPLLIPAGAQIIQQNNKKCAEFVDVDGHTQVRPLTEDGKFLAEPWYLREDAKEHYGISDQPLGKQGVIRHTELYIIRDAKRRRPKLATVWSGWDLDDLVAGKMERNPRLCGTSPYARKNRPVYRKRVEEFLREMEQHLPILASDAHALASEALFNGRPFKLDFVLKIKKNTPIITKPSPGSGCLYWWCLGSTTLPDDKKAENVSATNTNAFRERRPDFFKKAESQAAGRNGSLETSTTTPVGEQTIAEPGRGRGRPLGRTEDVLDLERRLIEAWDQQLYGKKKAAYAKAFDMQRSRVSAVICEYERSKKAYK